MGAPTVSYGLSPDGFEVLSDENGYRATGSYIMLWADAFTFHDQIMGITSAGRWQFPGSSASSLYTDSVRIVPIALDGSGNALPITGALGMIPGEFWTWARVDVTFKTPTSSQSSSDDTAGSNHFDPAAPIYGWEQTVRIGTRAETVDAEKITFDSATTTHPSKDSATIYKSDMHLTLHCPYTPSVPWGKYKLFTNTVNLSAIYGCAIGELLFIGADIQPAQGPSGKPGRSITIDLAVSDGDWNKLPFPGTGVPSLARYKDNTSKRLYAYKAFAALTTLP